MLIVAAAVLVVGVRRVAGRQSRGASARSGSSPTPCRCPPRCARWSSTPVRSRWPIRITTDRDAREPRVGHADGELHPRGREPVVGHQPTAPTARVTIDAEPSAFLRLGPGRGDHPRAAAELARRLTVTTQQEVGVVLRAGRPRPADRAHRRRRGRAQRRRPAASRSPTSTATSSPATRSRCPNRSAPSPRDGDVSVDFSEPTENRGRAIQRRRHRPRVAAARPVFRRRVHGAG